MVSILLSKPQLCQQVISSQLYPKGSSEGFCRKGSTTHQPCNLVFSAKAPDFRPSVWHRNRRRMLEIPVGIFVPPIASHNLRMVMIICRCETKYRLPVSSKKRTEKSHQKIIVTFFCKRTGGAPMTTFTPYPIRSSRLPLRPLFRHFGWKYQTGWPYNLLHETHCFPGFAIQCCR